MVPWLVMGAIAQVPPTPPALEVVVTAEGRVSEAREGLHRSLKDQAYFRVVRLGERTWYLNRKIWKPSVMVHEQGFARVRGLHALPVAFSPMAGGGTVTFVTQSNRAVQSRRGRVVQRIEPWLSELRDARWDLARGQRRVDLQIELAALWFEGVAPDGLLRPHYRDRRQAILDRWQATTPGDGGAWARLQIRDFVEVEVQPSEHPFDAEGWLTIATR